jgi:hypothetical protein
MILLRLPQLSRSFSIIEYKEGRKEPQNPNDY